jgi:hypothetical protein
MSNMAITDWLTFTPAGVVRNAKAYIDLPAFSYSAQGTAGEASIIVAQFNFSASRDFYLVTRPTKPSGVNYGLCIRWRVGETVYRYKLWEDASFILNNETPLYNRQRIRANFVLEIWNFAGSASSNAAAIRMITSVRTAPTDFRSIADYALAVGAEFTDLNNTNTYSIPSGLTSRWKADDVSTGPVATWVDTVNGTQLEQASSLNRPTKFVADSIWTKGYVNFADAGSDYMSCTMPNLGVWRAGSVYLVAEIDTTPVGEVTNWAMESGGVTFFKGTNNLFSNRFYVSGNSILSLIDPAVARVFRNYYTYLTSMGKQVDDGALATQSVAAPIADPITLEVGRSAVDGTYGPMKLADILFFKDKTLSAAEDIQLRQYLRWYHFGEIPFDGSGNINFNAGSAWLDNAPL